MRILIDSYNNVTQNASGGVQIRIQKHVNVLKGKGFDCKLFDKWTDKISDYNILHIFKVTNESYSEICYAKSLKIPVVVSSIIPLQGSLKIKIARFLKKYAGINTGFGIVDSIFEDADIIATQTILEANFICRNFKIPSSKVRVIPNGVNIDYDFGNKDVIIKEYPQLESRGYILQVGRFDRNKNQLSVIRAMKGSNIPLVFVGGPDPRERDYWLQCKQETDSNTLFLGWLDNDSALLQSAYMNAKVVVLPSHKEIYGNSLIEGGAAGANLVATRVLPINDWKLQSFCKKIDPKSLIDIKNKLVMAFNESLSPDLPNLITEKFSWDVVGDEYIKIYKSLVK
jgi:glycosyltransferase involved in cell wall biosynthesis